jgi:CRISPR-associated protein Cmr6
MSSPNIGWLFYKGYYRNLTNDDYLFMLLSKEEKKRREQEEKTLEEKIDSNVQKVIDQPIMTKNSETLGNSHFKATSTYPGLILGSGNDHELPDIKGQAILGFHFDYTSGLPVISGSSIKGVLRSAFKHPDYIAELLSDEVNIEELEKEIFDNGDIFFDATIISNGKILGDDYITPHGDALKNPIPLRFIKVLPNIEFIFDFKLSDRGIDKEKKSLLFTQILSDLGLGAKTNVGYGKFTNIKIFETEEEKLEQEQKIEEAKEEALANMSPVERIFDLYEHNPTKVILAMQSGEIEEYESIKVALAQRVKEELQKEPKNWERAKQKALKRKEFIEGILG